MDPADDVECKPMKGTQKVCQFCDIGHPNSGGNYRGNNLLYKIVANGTTCEPYEN